jgi:16S rRNA (cytidine1402-2'-O)-methyltransferase
VRVCPGPHAGGGIIIPEADRARSISEIAPKGPETRQAMAGTLFVVATPIGNLEDITLRALRVLREVDVIAAEDTRHTARLLARHGIATPTISFHEHNVRGRVPQLVDRLIAGSSVAVVSDAGTPGVSDPGSELIQACLAAGIPIEPIPGPSAPLAAVVASGFPIIPLTILGFPPHRSKDRIAWLQDLTCIRTTVTFFEAPHRIAATLNEATHILGDRPIVVARELTKVHQEFLRGTAKVVAGMLSSAPKGEITVVIAPLGEVAAVAPALTDEQVADAFGRMPDDGADSHGGRVAAAAKHLGMSRRQVYAALERIKGSGE